MESLRPSSTKGPPQENFPLPRTAHSQAWRTQGYNQYLRSEGRAGLLLRGTKSSREICRLPQLCCTRPVEEIPGTHLYGYSHFYEILQILILC